MSRIVLMIVLHLPGTMSADVIKVMHLTGQSSKHHSWEATADAINQHLASAGLFGVDIVTSPARGEGMDEFAPRFKDYDVVVLNYDGEEWSIQTKTDFVEYVREGGGLVTVHATCNSFAYWPEYNEIIGVGGWGGAKHYNPPLYPDQPERESSRNEKWGPRVYWEDRGMVRDDIPGVAKHPRKHDFIITRRTPDHPITSGLPGQWQQPHDEIYSGLRGPAKNLTILATAYANQDLKNASPHNEPMIFTVGYGKGRVLQITLGHVGARDNASVLSVSNVGFGTVLQRGVEWAATGSVTQTVPDDFPAVAR